MTLARVVLPVLLLLGTSIAEPCVRFVPPLLHDTTSTCVGDPRHRRSVGLERLGWHGEEMLVENVGNELRIFSLAQPAVPQRVASSSFRVDLSTDDDENLKGYSICDDCRFGVAGFGIEGVVLFDLGTGPAPRFASARQYDAQPIGMYVGGGFTYRVGGQQYLMAAGVTAACQGAGLYRFASTAVGALDLVGCVRTPLGTPLFIDGGVHLQSAGREALYVQANGTIHIFTIDASGAELAYYGSFGATSGPSAFDVDRNAGRAVTANGATVSLWDIGDPLQPALLWQGVPGDDPGLYTVAAVRGDVVFAAKSGRVTAGAVGHLLSLRDPGQPVSIDPAAWSPSGDWNGFCSCLFSYDAAFSPDGTALYLARYAAAQVFSLAECAVPALETIFGDDFERGSCTAWSADPGAVP